MPKDGKSYKNTGPSPGDYANMPQDQFTYIGKTDLLRGDPPDTYVMPKPERRKK